MMKGPGQPAHSYSLMRDLGFLNELNIIQLILYEVSLHTRIPFLKERLVCRLNAFAFSYYKFYNLAFFLFCRMVVKRQNTFE